jgi:hypothetical protein
MSSLSHRSRWVLWVCWQVPLVRGSVTVSQKSAHSLPKRKLTGSMHLVVILPRGRNLANFVQVYMADTPQIRSVASGDCLDASSSAV